MESAKNSGRGGKISLYCFLIILAIFSVIAFILTLTKKCQKDGFAFCPKILDGKNCGSYCCYGGTKCCGSTCCGDGEECCGGKCCGIGEICCGGQCCGIGEICCGGKCCKWAIDPPSCCGNQCISNSKKEWCYYKDDPDKRYCSGENCFYDG